MLEHGLQVPTFPKRVVIIGAGGFVGGAIATRLAREGVEVVALGRRDIDFADADASQRLQAILRPTDAVVAAAAAAPCVNTDMLVDNLVLSRAITSALAASPVDHVVNISSDAIYADSDGPLTENSCASPGSIHGAMHLAREILFRGAVAGPIAMLRPTLIYGAADPHNGYGPNRFVRLARAGQPISLFGEGEERRDHVSIDDVAELATRVLFRRSRGDLNIATGATHSFRSIAEQAVELSGGRSRIVTLPRSGPMPHRGYRPFDVSAVGAAFPGFSFTSLEQGLSRLWESGRDG